MIIMFKRFLGLGLAAAMLFSPAAATEIKDVSDKVTVLTARMRLPKATSNPL